MKPIINPWLFYLANISDDVRIFFIVIGFALLFLSSITLGVLVIDGIYDEEDRCRVKFLVKWLINGVILLLLGLLIPPKEVIYQMMIAQNITPDNLQNVGEGVKSIVDYILEAAMKLKGE